MANVTPPAPGMEDTLPQVTPPPDTTGGTTPPAPGMEPEQTQAAPAQSPQPGMPWSDIAQTAADFASGPPGWAKQTYQAGSEYLRHQLTPRAAFAKGAKDILTGNLLPADQQYEKQLTAEHPYAETAGKAAGLGTMMIPGAQMPTGLVKFGLAGRLGWQAAVGAGLGGWTGFSTGHDFNERVRRAGTDAVIGGGLGLAGGALGEAANAGVNKVLGPYMDRATKAAIREAGLSPEESAAAQQGEIREMLGHHFPIDAGPEGFQTVQGKLATQARGMRDQAIDLLHLAGSKGASLSADAVSAVKQNVVQDLAREGINVDKNIAMTSKGRQALNILDNLQDEAAQKGNLSLQSLADAHKNINALYDRNDRALLAVRRGYDKWIKNVTDAHLFSGDESALQDWYGFRKGYTEYKQFIDPHNALGNIIKNGLNADHVSNWLTAVGDTKGHAAVELAQNLKGILGENSPEWAAIRNFMWSKALNVRPDVAIKPNTIVAGINKVLTSPVSREIYQPEELETMAMMRHALSSLPSKAPLREWLTEAMQGSLATIAGIGTGGPEALERHHAGADPFTTAWPMIRNALLAWGAEKGARFAAPVVRGVPPALKIGTAPLGLAATRTPTLDYIIHGDTGERKSRGGGVANSRGAASRAAALATQIARGSRPRETGQGRP